MSKDYYRILGVLDDAEDIVIKAAYKALAQRYHPDKWVGDKDEATCRMSDINEAYGVLSDPVKRAEYDSTRDKNSYQAEPEDDEIGSSVESDWNKVLKFFPDLVKSTERLRKISKILESAFKITMLESKQFERRKEIAEIFESQFLKKYFGTSEQIINYARSLILLEQKDALRALNEAVNLLGSDVNPSVIIENINSQFMIRDKSLVDLAKKIVNRKSNSDLASPSEESVAFIKKLGGTVSITHKNFSSDIFNIEFRGKSMKMTTHDFLDYVRNVANQHLNYV